MVTQFPASHMVGDTWINSGYEGEIARCLPGSVLKVMVGSVMMSTAGMAVSMNDAQILSCAPGQAVRHYKDGMLKCALAEKVVDCTERNNLRKWGNRRHVLHLCHSRVLGPEARDGRRRQPGVLVLQLLHDGRTAADGGGGGPGQGP